MLSTPFVLPSLPLSAVSSSDSETVVSPVLNKRLKNFAAEQIYPGHTVASSIFGTVVGAIFAGPCPGLMAAKRHCRLSPSSLLWQPWDAHFVTAWAGFIAFRVLGGLAVGASSVIAPCISPRSRPAHSGRLAGSFQVNIVAGINGRLPHQLSLYPSPN